VGISRPGPQRLGAGQGEALPGELAEVVRQAGREFREMVEAEALPTAGSA
jgi:hypothetical protein